MKKLKLSIGLILVLCTIATNIYSQGAFQVRRQNAGDRAIMLGYNDYRYLTFGAASATPNNGAWSIEHWDGGLNFWRPWNTWNSGNYKMFISDGGFVGVNMKPIDWHTKSIPYSCGFLGWSTCYYTVGNFRLQVTGNAISHGWYTWSDVSIKSNVTNVTGALSKVLALRPVEYNYNQGALNIWKDSTMQSDSNEVKQETINADATKNIHTGEPKHIGLIAQEVSQVLPNIVSPIGNSQAVNYVELVPILIKAIQEQQETIQNLRQEITNWKGKALDSVQDQTRLFQNTPNPFEGSTTISYYIDENTSISSAAIEIRDIMGNLKSTLTLGDRSGMGQIDYDGSSLNMGYYIYTLKVNGSVKDSKMFLKEN